MAGTMYANALVNQAGLRSGLTSVIASPATIDMALGWTRFNNRWRALKTHSGFRRDQNNASDQSRPIPVAHPVFTESPSALTLTLTLTTPTVTYQIAPAALALSLSIPTPQLNRVQYPAALSLALSIATPTVSLGTVTVSPSALVLSLDTPDPSVGIGGFILPSAVALSLSLTTPSLTMGAVSVAPDPLVLALSLTTGKTVLTQYPSPIALALSLPTVNTIQTVNVSAVSLALSDPDPTISNDIAALAIELSLPEPTLIIGRRLLQPAPLILGLTLPYTLGSTTTVTNSVSRKPLKVTYSATLTAHSISPVSFVISRVQGSRQVQFATVREYAQYQWEVYIAYVLAFYREVKAEFPDDAETQLETTQWITFLESLNIPEPVSPGNKDDLMVVVPNAASVLPGIQSLLSAHGTLHIRMDVTYSDGGVMWFNLAQGTVVSWDRNKGPRQDTLTIRCQDASPWIPRNVASYADWTSQSVAQFSMSSTDGVATIKVPAGAGDPNLPAGFFYGIHPGDSLVLPSLGGTITVTEVDYEISAAGGSVTLKG